MHDLKPVYLCINAIKREHNCKWIVCYACYIAHDEKERHRIGDIKNTRRSIQNSKEDNERDVRNALNQKYDNNMCRSVEETKNMCKHDHKHLVDFHGKQYFTKTYQDKIVADEIQFPTHCILCHRKISSSE